MANNERSTSEAAISTTPPEPAAEDPRGPQDNHCFVCGDANPAGLRLRFRLDGEVCRAEFTPDARQQGYDNVMHGGLLFALLDDVMANWLWLNGYPCFTARADVRYRSPVPIGVPLHLEGRLLRRRGRLFEMQGLVLDAPGGAVLTESEARFMAR